GSLKTPKTPEPLPVMAATPAPAALRRALISPMGGHRKRAYGSKSFPARAHVSTSRARLPFGVGLKSGMLLIFKAGVNDAQASAYTSRVASGTPGSMIRISNPPLPLRGSSTAPVPASRAVHPTGRQGAAIALL